MFSNKVTHASLEKNDGKVTIVETEMNTDTTIMVKA
jgi:hypothetical protein